MFEMVALKFVVDLYKAVFENVRVRNLYHHRALLLERLKYEFREHLIRTLL